jgi:neutral ceramidase
MRAGYQTVDITPPAGVDLTGFIARKGPCAGTLDPLEARALVFEDARGHQAALVTCDLIGLGRHLVARVRRRVAEATGIPATAQLFNCSHTHAGPETGVLTTIGLPDPRYLALLEERLVSVVTAAARELLPVRVAVAAGDAPEGLVINRVFRRVDRPEAYDRQITVVRLDREDGSDERPLATLVAFACHAVALGSEEQHASADYVGTLRRALEDAGTGPVLYVNGCGGDVNPASMDRRGREASEALGLGLAEAALPLWREARPDGVTAGDQVTAAQEWVTLPYQAVRTAEEAAAILAAGRERLVTAVPGSPSYRGTRVTEVEYPLRLLRLHYGNETVPLAEAEVQALRIGSFAVVGLPGEIFSSIGRQIKQASPFPSPYTLVAGWTNDNVGYIPDRAAYPLGGYEVDSASRYYGHPAGWAPEAGEALAAAARRLLAQVCAG